jgi:cysteine desulfurase
MKVYFDNAATTPLDPEVMKEMLPVLQNDFGNPSSIHSHGRPVRALIENARKNIARHLNVTPGEIFFTSGGTEADNMAIHGAVFDLGCKHAITSSIEHHAVLHTLEHLEKKGFIKLSLVKLDKLGNIDLGHLEELLAHNPNSFVSLMHGNNEVANLIPLEKVAELCAKYSAWFHSDTVQTMGHYKFNLKDLNLHFLTGAAHKFHGPKGIGFLYIRNDTKISPLLFGGAQERNMRGGTENVYGIVGLSKAMDLCYSAQEEHESHIRTIKQYFRNRIESEIPGVGFNGNSASDDSLYTVLSVHFPKNPQSEMMLFSLDISGISASGGSACSSGSNQGSHVLKALNVDQSTANVRFSFSRFNTKEEVDFVIDKLKEIFPSAS